MRKILVLFAILLLGMSFSAIAEDAPPADQPSSPPSDQPQQPPQDQQPPVQPQQPPQDQQPPVQPQQPPQDQQPPVQPQQPPQDQQPPVQPQQPPQGGCYVGEQRVPCPEDRPPQEQPGQPQQTREGCYVGEQRVPCPGENVERAPQVSQGCKEIRDANGMVRVLCEGQPRPTETMTCTPGPEREAIEKKCAETGGRIITKNIDTQRGCGIVECVYGQESGSNMFGGQAICPPVEELKKKEQECQSMGMNAIRVKSGCDYIKCVGKESQQMGCPDNSMERMKIKEDCSQKGGRVTERFDSAGCSWLDCMSEGQECGKNVPQEAYWKCEDQGGKLVVDTDEQGCITFSKCVKRGSQEDLEYEEVDEVPAAAKLLSVALKLETIKISFDKLAKQVEEIAKYYESEDDQANADRFHRAAGVFNSAKSKIDEIRQKLRENVKGMTPEALSEIKYEMKQISNVVMEDALYIILGESSGETYESTTTAEASQQMKESTRKDCGNDVNCFSKALRICDPEVTVQPESGVELKIVGIDGAVCLLKGQAKGMDNAWIECKYPDYATTMLTKENLLPYCEGPMVEMIKKGEIPQAKMESTATQVVRPGNGEGMMGCEKIANGFSPKDVCGNECCEPMIGEDYYNCPKDCMKPMPMNERAENIVREESIDQLALGGAATFIDGIKDFFRR